MLAEVAAFAMQPERVQEFLSCTISQTGIEYRESPLSKTLPGLPGTAPQAGDRFPWLQLDLGTGAQPKDLFQVLDDRHFTLLLFGAGAPDTAPVSPGCSMSSPFHRSGER